MCSSREKKEIDSVKWTKNHGFREQKMPWYRGFIWRTRPHIARYAAIGGVEGLELKGLSYEIDFKNVDEN